MEAFIMRCYVAWIEENIPKDEIDSNCTLWARVMHQAFPELILVGGYAVKKKNLSFEEELGSLGWGAFNCNYHEYLITENGDIVDPTGRQFDWLIGKGLWEYDRCEEHLLY